MTVRVDENRHGAWEVALPGRRKRVVCETLDDAKRVGYLWNAHRHPCWLIVRDANCRVMLREFIAGDEDAGRAGSGS